jgi:hypothetical protein
MVFRKVTRWSVATAGDAPGSAEKTLSAIGDWMASRPGQGSRKRAQAEVGDGDTTVPVGPVGAAG